MKAVAFAYHAPASLGEVRGLLERYGVDAVPLAGGQSLVPLMALRLLRPRVLIDLNGVPELAGIRAGPGAVTVAAMTRQRAVERSPLVATRLPLLAGAMGHVGHPQVRNRGTVGGSLAAGHPCAELPAVALALDAEFVVVAPRSERMLSAEEFYRVAPGAEAVGRACALAADEVLTEVRFRVPPPGAGHGFHETSRRVRDFPTAGAAVVLGRDRAGRCAYARVALLGAGPGPLRAGPAERVLLDGPLTSEVIAAAAGAAGDLVSGESLRDMTVALTARALADAARRARPSEGRAPS